jgi:hypothetical protein
MWDEFDIFQHKSPLRREVSSSYDLSTSKSVHIVEQNNRVHYINGRSELTHEEHRSCFFMDAEYSAIRQRENELSRILDPQPAEPEVGLESRREKRMRRQRINECVMSVMLEQELRELEGAPMDPLFLARLVVSYSCHSAKLAYTRALENAVQVHGHPKGLSPPTMPVRSVSPTTLKEELRNRLQQQRLEQQDDSPSSSGPIKPSQYIVSHDSTMAAEFEPPRSQRSERSPQFGPRLSPFAPRTTIYESPDHDSRRAVSLSQSRPYHFVLPHFPVWDERWAIRDSQSHWTTAQKSRCVLEEEIDEERWI